MPSRHLRRRVCMAAAVASALGVAGCASDPAPPPRTLGGLGPRPPAYNRPYEVRGRWYSPHAQPRYDEVGVASWYGYESPSRRTADGEPFDIAVPSAAHATLPIPSWLEVTDLDNGRRLRVRLNDRGPFASGRLIDLSRAAAQDLGFVRQGTARVRVRYLGPAEPLAASPTWAMAALRRPASRPPVAAAPAPSGSGVAPDPVLEPRVDPRLDPRAEVAADADDAFGPDPGAPAPSQAAPSDEPARLEVQAATFADRDNAVRAAARLAAAGAARIEPLYRADGVLYRVLIGDLAGARAADDARSEAVALGFTGARVIAR